MSEPLIIHEIPMNSHTKRFNSIMFYHRHCWYSFPLSPCSQLFQNNGCPPFSISQFIIITSLSSPPCKTFSRASTTSTLQTVINISIFFQYQTSGEPLITLLPYSRNTIFFCDFQKNIDLIVTVCISGSLQSHSFLITMEGFLNLAPTCSSLQLH